MYLNRNQKGYGWHVTVRRDSKGNEIKPAYVNFTFKKGCEPSDSELSGEFGSYEGELYLETKQGRRKVFPYVNEYNESVEFKILDYEQPQEKKESSNFGGKTSKSAQSVDIEPDELPFY